MGHDYKRLIEPYILDLMTAFPAIAIDGLKGVGKTVSTKRIAKTVFELDRIRDFDRLANSLETLSSAPKPVLIDEWQRIPRVWDYVRRAVDDGAAPGSFLLTGSIANDDMNIHSGAGRIIKQKMYPLSLAERDLEIPTVSLRDMLSAESPFSIEISGETEVTFRRYMNEIAASGLPAFRKFNQSQRKIVFESYFENMLTHEFDQQGVKLRQPQTLLRWLRAFAAAISTDAGYNEILDASTAGEGHKPAVKTTIAYREALGNLWLLDELEPWMDGEDFFSELKRSPKHYLADPAFAAYLLGLDEDTLGGTGTWPFQPGRFDEKYGSILGRLFEALVQLSLNVYSGANGATLSFMRTRPGDREIDFIIQKGSRVIACEVKLAPQITDHDVRHLLWFREKIGTRLADAIIITTGSFAYRRPDGVAVVPAALLGA
jgi:predicted AAA+ superfamily ATPase